MKHAAGVAQNVALLTMWWGWNRTRIGAVLRDALHDLPQRKTFVLMRLPRGTMLVGKKGVSAQSVPVAVNGRGGMGVRGRWAEGRSLCGTVSGAGPRLCGSMRRGRGAGGGLSGVVCGLGLESGGLAEYFRNWPLLM